MKQIIITLDGPEIIRLEKDGNKDAVAKVISSAGSIPKKISIRPSSIEKSRCH